jgi:hypothetical protein
MKIEYIPRSISEQFAEEFAGNKKGFSTNEISDYFLEYSNNVKHHQYYGFKLKRSDLFLESLYTLEPKLQYYSLNELAFNERNSKYQYPSQEIRNNLRDKLHNLFSPNLLGFKYSNLNEKEFRQNWIKTNIYSKINSESAMTNARSSLETILKQILIERVETDTSQGDLGKLIKQTSKLLGLNDNENNGEIKITSGIASIVNGIASITNELSDRHGSENLNEYIDPRLVDLLVNISGSLGLYFIDTHNFTDLIQNEN